MANAKENPDRYNGWTNYETWCVNLWLTNDADSAAGLSGLAEQAYRDAVADEVLSRAEVASNALAEQLKSHHEEGNPFNEAESSVYTDLLQAALDSVNWDEIAVEHIGEARSRIDAEKPTR
jgi:hypothetical protein